MLRTRPDGVMGDRELDELLPGHLLRRLRPPARPPREDLSRS